MIKAPKHFISAALALVMLSGCADGINEPDPAVEKVSPDFTATIVGTQQSRAYDQTWEATDMIGISSDKYANVCYAYNPADGTFSAANPADKIYYQEKDTVVFTAYYPYHKELELPKVCKIVETDTREQTISRQKEFDFLWAQDTGISRKPIVDLIFRHTMAKVVITVKPDLNAGFTYDDMMAATLSLKGIRHKGTFDVVGGIAEADYGQAPEAWQFSDKSDKSDESGQSVTYTFILFPQTFDGPVEFLVDLPTNHLSAKINFAPFNKKIDGDEAATNGLVGGRQYNLSITLSRKQLLFNQDGSSINPWDEESPEINAGSDDSDEPDYSGDPEEEDE